MRLPAKLTEDPLTDGEAYWQVLRDLHTYSYMETFYASRTKTLPHDFHLPRMESIPKISIALIPPSPNKENPPILGIQSSSPPLYKQQFSSFPRYTENP